MKVLIVDDSKTMRMIVTRTLKKTGLSGLTTAEAGNGLEAIEAIKNDRPDIILCDWNMPEMNGIELLEHLRKEEDSVKFGFVTTECTDEIRRQAAEAGADFFITKPFTAETFEAQLGDLATS